MPCSKVIWHQKRGKSPVFRVWNQHFFNFTTSLWSEVQLTYIFVFTIFLGNFRAIGIGLHSRDSHTLKCFHSAVQGGREDEESEGGVEGEGGGEDEGGERVALRKSVEGEEFASTWADHALIHKLWLWYNASEAVDIISLSIIVVKLHMYNYVSKINVSSVWIFLEDLQSASSS